MAYQGRNGNASLISYETFLRFSDKIPHNERDIYQYYQVFKFNQKDIANLTGLTQSAISHKLGRIQSRLIFLDKLDRLFGRNPDKIFESLKEYCDPFEIELLRAVYDTTNQSQSADILNVIFNLKGDVAMNQIKVKHRFNMILKKLIGSGYYRIFKYIENGWYMNHEVRLPQFDKRHYE